MPNQPSPLVSTFLAWIELTMHRTMHGVVRYTRERGLSMSQLSTLFQLAHHGSLAVSEISDGLGVSKAAASQLLDRLVQQELVTRTENPQDRREKQLVLTEKGRTLLLESTRTRETWLEGLVGTLTPAEQAKVSDVLELLIVKMNQLADQS
jgi:DNA-binding MarR family transcriptional regulator